MALLCGSTSITPLLSNKNVVAASSKSSFGGFQLSLPKLTLSSSVRTLLPSNSRIRCQQDSATAAPVEDPRFACVEPEPRFKGPVQYNRSFFLLYFFFDKRFLLWMCGLLIWNWSHWSTWLLEIYGVFFSN